MDNEIRKNEVENLKEYKYGFSTDIENIKAPKGLNAEVISSSLVQVDAATLQIGGTSVNKTLIDNVKLSFSDSVVQTSNNVTTTASTGSFTGFVSSSLFLLSSVQGAPLTPKAGGIMFSGSAFYLGFE